jgi:hypothetical protein
MYRSYNSFGDTTSSDALSLDYADAEQFSLHDTAVYLAFSSSSASQGLFCLFYYDRVCYNDANPTRVFLRSVKGKSQFNNF